VYVKSRWKMEENRMGRRERKGSPGRKSTEEGSM
jgi:hypothetical protein